MFTTLLNKILDTLNDMGSFQETYGYEIEQFNGDPVAVVVPSSNESDYNTTQENVRIYAFKLRIFVNRDIKVRDKTTADRILRDLVSSTLDTFDKNYTFTGLVVPTGYTFINVFALPSLWGYAGREDEYRVAEINIQCRVSVDLNSLP